MGRRGLDPLAGHTVLFRAEAGCAVLSALLLPVSPPPNAGEVCPCLKPPLHWAARVRPRWLAPPRRPSWLAHALGVLRAAPRAPRLLSWQCAAHRARRDPQARGERRRIPQTSKAPAQGSCGTWCSRVLASGEGGAHNSSIAPSGKPTHLPGSFRASAARLARSAATVQGAPSMGTKRPCRCRRHSSKAPSYLAGGRRHCPSEGSSTIGATPSARLKARRQYTDLQRFLSVSLARGNVASHASSRGCTGRPCVGSSTILICGRIKGRDDECRRERFT